MNTAHTTIGIDVGKDVIHIGFLPHHSRTNYEDYPTVKLDMTDPGWWRTLLELVGESATIAAEPTGHHLLAPIATILNIHRPSAELWLVDHKQTERHRSTFVSGAKNDRLDAIALCLIASDIQAGKHIRNVRLFDYAASSVVQQLRLRVNTHQRLTRESTRTANRLDKLAYGIFPLLAQRPTTYISWIRIGAATPAEIHTLVESPDFKKMLPDGRSRRHMRELAEDLPEGLPTDPEIVEVIREQVAALDSLEPQIEANLAHIRRLILHPQLAPVTRRWMSMPQWSAVAIAALHVATHGNALTMTKPEFQSACGVAPRTAISGDDDRTRNDMRGYRPVKAALHMWAGRLCSPLTPANDIRAYYRMREDRYPHKVVVRGKRKKQVNQNFSAAKNKLARVLWGVARNARLDALTPYEEALPNPSEGAATP